MLLTLRSRKTGCAFHILQRLAAMHKCQRGAESDGHEEEAPVHRPGVDGNDGDEEDAEDDGRDYEAGGGDEDAAKRDGRLAGYGRGWIDWGQTHHDRDSAVRVQGQVFDEELAVDAAKFVGDCGSWGQGGAVPFASVELRSCV